MRCSKQNGDFITGSSLSAGREETFSPIKMGTLGPIPEHTTPSVQHKQRN